ncbi:MAG: DUF1501 domain-containing protein [Planctomycetota bacterium]|jgi:uncharacterized protein (DUF1501 family)
MTTNFDLRGSGTDRRDFLKIAGASAAALGLSGLAPAFGQEPAPGTTAARPAEGTKPTLVALYLRGGMDAIGALVPYQDSTYYAIRPTIAIPAESVIKLDDTFGLHPSLAPLQKWWDAKRLAPIINVGSHHNTRSHFSAQDYMEYAAPGMPGVTQGWLNRYLNLTRPADVKQATMRALAMQGLLPRALRGEYPVLAVPKKRTIDDRNLRLFREIYGEKTKKSGGMEMGGRREDDQVVNAGRETLGALDQYKKIIGKPAGDAPRYPASKLGGKLHDVARVIHAGVGLEVAALDAGGWDDHANEGGAEGNFANRLGDLARSLDAFATDLGPKLDHTCIVVMTEFGRVAKENGNAGTDHGHGGLWFVLGGATNGGKIHGEWCGLEPKALNQKRDLAVTTDFRDVFHTVLQSHLRFDVPKDFFPSYAAKTVEGLL